MHCNHEIGCINVGMSKLLLEMKVSIDKMNKHFVGRACLQIWKTIFRTLSFIQSGSKCVITEE